MRGYVVSKGGIFGVVEREYLTESGVEMLVIRWGPLGWLTPVEKSSCKNLSSRYEAEARKEAGEWLGSQNSRILEMLQSLGFADSEPPTPFVSMEDIAKRRFTGDE